MALRIPCPRRQISPGLFTRLYWPGGKFITPSLDIFLVCGQLVVPTSAGIDTQSDFIVCPSASAIQLGLTPPFGRQVPFSGAAGTQAGVLSFADDGIVGLFVTDFTEYCYLPAQPIGFHPATERTCPTTRGVGNDGVPATLPLCV